MTERHPKIRGTTSILHMATRQHSSETLKTHNTMPQIDDCMLTFHRPHNHQPTNNMHTQIQLYSEADFATLQVPTGHTEQRTCHMPTHTTLGLVFTRTYCNHIKRKKTIECVPSRDRHESNHCWTWNQSNPKPTPISDMCPTWRTTKHKTLMLQRIESESP